MKPVKHKEKFRSYKRAAEIARDTLVKWVNKDNPSTYSVWVSVEEKDRELYVTRMTGPCHYQLMSANVPGSRVVGLATYTGNTSHRKDVKLSAIQVKQYTDGLVYRSCFSRAFHHGMELPCGDGYALVLDVQAPSNLLAGACVGSRYPREFPSRVQLYCDFIVAGMPPEFAILAQEGVSFIGKTRANFKSGGGGGHSMFPASIDSKMLKNLLIGRVVNSNLPYNKVRKYYFIDNLWGTIKPVRGKGTPLLGDIMMKYVPEHNIALYQSGWAGKKLPCIKSNSRDNLVKAITKATLNYLEA